MKKTDITIFTDGSSRGNPGPGGWGAIVIHNETVDELGGAERHTTNNRMELNAVIQALQFVATKPELVTQPIGINTDSSYVLKGATQWVHGWKKNNWRTKTKDDVLNKDLWEQLLKVSEGLTLNWNLLKGHSGIPANERCDVIATSFADKSDITLFSGEISQYSVDVFHVPSTVSQIKKSSKSKSKTKAYSYVSSVNGNIKTHTTWAECEARVKGKSGALFKKAVSVQDEKDIIEQWKLSQHS